MEEVEEEIVGILIEMSGSQYGITSQYELLVSMELPVPLPVGQYELPVSMELPVGQYELPVSIELPVYMELPVILAIDREQPDVE